MSPRSRIEYYNEITLPDLVDDDKETIPEIASLCGFSDIKDLDTHIEKTLGKDGYFNPSSNFNAWKINRCEEDLKIIVQPSG